MQGSRVGAAQKRLPLSSPFYPSVSRSSTIRPASFEHHQSCTACTEDEQTLTQKSYPRQLCPQEGAAPNPHLSLSEDHSLPMLSFVPCWEQGCCEHLKSSPSPARAAAGTGAPKSCPNPLIRLSSRSAFGSLVKLFGLLPSANEIQLK